MQTQSVKLNFPELEASLEIQNVDEKTIVYQHNSEILFKEDRYNMVIYATLDSLFVNRAPINVRALFSKGRANKQIPVGDFYKWFLGMCSRFQLGGQRIKEEQVKRIKLRLADHVYTRIYFSDSSDCSVASNVNYIWIKSIGHMLIYDKHTRQMTLNGEHIDNLKINRSSANFLITTWHVKWLKFLRILNSKAKAEKPNIQPLCPIRGGLRIRMIRIEAMASYKFVQQLGHSYSFIDSTDGHSLIQLGDNVYCDGIQIRTMPFYARLRTIRLAETGPYFKFFDMFDRYIDCLVGRWTESSSSSSFSSEIKRLDDASELDDSEQELAIVFSNNFRSTQIMKSQMDQIMDRKEEFEKEEAKNICSICLDRELAYAAIPCAHLCCCASCYLPLKQCPICKAKVDKFMRIFIA